MQVCYDYVGPIAWWAGLTPEAQAGWLSAFGGIMAILFTIIFWIVDRVRAGKERKEKLLDRERHAWRQAVLLMPIIQAGYDNLQKVYDQFKAPIVNPRQYGIGPLLIPGLDRIRERLTDPTAFGRTTQRDLLMYLSYGEDMNDALGNSVQMTAHGPMIEWPTGNNLLETKLELLRNLAESLNVAIRLTVNEMPK